MKALMHERAEGVTPAQRQTYQIEKLVVSAGKLFCTIPRMIEAGPHCVHVQHNCIIELNCLHPLPLFLCSVAIVEELIFILHVYTSLDDVYRTAKA